MVKVFYQVFQLSNFMFWHVLLIKALVVLNQLRQLSNKIEFLHLQRPIKHRNHLFIAQNKVQQLKLVCRPNVVILSDEIDQIEHVSQLKLIQNKLEKLQKSLICVLLD